MVQFSVPVKTAQKADRFFSFSVIENAVMFAGSRNASVPQNKANALIKSFARLGFSFFVGCARGVDQCFRKALANSNYHSKTFVACAYAQRLNRSFGLFASVVVPESVHPKAALVRRTLWMVKRSSLVVLFPDNPETGKWGKGSTLVFNNTIHQLKPLFVVTKNPPQQNGLYRVLPSSFFGIVTGFWAIPHPISKGGTCDDEF